MSITLPEYHRPDFSQTRFVSSPDAAYACVEKNGVANAQDFITPAAKGLHLMQPK